MSVFERSWRITKITFDVIRKDKEMLLFALLGGVTSILFACAMLFPTLIASLMAGRSSPIGILFVFFTYMGLSVIATYFNVCTVYTAKKRFEGGDATFGESLRFGFGRLGTIFMWGLVSGTVGLILHMVESAARKKNSLLLSVIRGMLGMAWSLITIFVVPSIVYYDLTPMKAIKKSVSTLKKTWGESLIRYYGLGLAQGMLVLAGILAAGIIIYLVPPLFLVVIGLLVVYIILLILVFNVANMVFNTALFVYAEKGIVPQGYTEDVLNGAFKR